MTVVVHWEGKNTKELLTLLVGQSYGPDPETQLDRIQQNQYYQSQNVIKDLGLQSTDCVIDLGSGCGFMANHVSSAVKELYCVDISDSFLLYARQVNRKNSNVHFCKIEPACLEKIPQATAIYSTTVFTAFNLYDVYLYLLACYQNLFPGGRMLFDFVNDQHFNVKSTRWLHHVDVYKKDRQRTFVLHYHSDHIIKTMAQDIGFIVQWTRASRDQTHILLVKP